MKTLLLSILLFSSISFAFEPIPSEILWNSKSILTRTDANEFYNYVKSEPKYGLNSQKVCFNGSASEAIFKTKHDLKLKYKNFGHNDLEVSFAKDESSKYYGPYRLYPCVSVAEQRLFTYILDERVKKCLLEIEKLKGDYIVSAGNVTSAKNGKILDVRLRYDLIQQGDIVVGKAFLQLLITEGSTFNPSTLNSCDVKVEIR